LAQAPVDTLAQAPVDTLAQAPVDTLAEAPVDTLAEAPVDTLAEAPVDTLAEAPVDTLAQAPVDTLAQAPVGTLAADLICVICQDEWSVMRFFRSNDLYDILIYGEGGCDHVCVCETCCAILLVIDPRCPICRAQIARCENVNV
jgi:hypothetical protein